MKIRKPGKARPGGGRSHDQQDLRLPAQRLVRRRLGSRGDAHDPRPHVAGRPLALYRTEDGRPVALADACWHRLAPLSLGKLIGKEEIQCPYHGHPLQRGGPLHLDAGAGDHQPQRRPSPRSRWSSATAFSGSGSATRRSPTPPTIPDMHQMDRPRLDRRRADDLRPLQLPARSRQPDGSHARGVRARLEHRPSRAQRVRLRGDPRRHHGHRHPVDARHRPAAVLAQEHARQVPGLRGQVDRWQIIHFEAPSTICIDVGVAKAGTGAPEGDRSQGVNGYVMNTISPETDQDLPLLLVVPAQLPPRQPAHHHAAAQGVHDVFGEDEAMLTAQQAAIDANPDYEFYSLNIDAGGMWVRRPDRADAARPKAGSHRRPRVAAGLDAVAATHADVWQQRDRGRDVGADRLRSAGSCSSRHARRGAARRSHRRAGADRRPAGRRSYSVVDAPRTTGGASRSASSPRPGFARRAARHARARPRRPLEVTQPLLDFPLRLGAARYVLLAGGIGITALLAMASSAARRRRGLPARLRRPHRAAMAYLDDLLERARRPPAGCTSATRARSLDVDELVAGSRPSAGTELYMCGPIRLMDAVRRAWIERELPMPQPAIRDLRQQRRWPTRRSSRSRIPRLGHRDHGRPRPDRCSRHSRPPAPT